jgi:Dyp-type peroxidase family
MTDPPATATHPVMSDLEDIQGGIVGFNKPFQRLAYVNFPSGEAGRAFLRALEPLIANGQQVLEFNRLFKQAAGRPSHDLKATWTNVWLSAPGLEQLAAPGFADLPEDFRAGMAGQASLIGDVGPSDPGTWVAPFTDGAVPHAVVVVAADVEDDLAAGYADVQAAIGAAGVSELPPPQDGATLGGGREHFGFRDGVSQPGIKGLTEPSKEPHEVIAAGEFLVGYVDEQGQISGQPSAAPPPPPTTYNPAPAPSPPNPYPAWAHNGSFVVFRRLQQDVAAFRDIALQAAQARLAPEQLQAKVVGRWPTGAPMERVPGLPHDLDPALTDPSTVDDHVLDDNHINNFNYDSDPDGKGVPRAAHIRKANPRSSQLPDGDASNRHRLLRRGIPYGPPFVEGEPPYTENVPPQQDRGLLFVCYQASIADGFVFVQRNWANAGNFQQPGDGEDPIISQDNESRAFRLPGQDGEAQELSFAQWVKTTGGGYFFSPSLSGIRTLAPAPA